MITGLQHPEVRYETTNHCNAHCTMCPRELTLHTRPQGFMDLEKFKRSVDEVQQLGAKQIVLTGFGEPLMDPTLVDKIAYCTASGLRSYIISNASLLTADNATALIRAGLSELRISFLGMSTATYNAIMRRLDFETSLDNVNNLLRLRRELVGYTTPKVQVSYIVLPENEHETKRFQEYWEPRVEAIEIWKPHNFSSGRSYRERHNAIEFKRTCGRPENGPLQVQWDGTVIPCCFDFNNEIVLGNAFSTSVLEILNGPLYSALRDAHATKQFSKYPLCDQCDQLLDHPDALVYSNRHNLPPKEAVQLSNTDLFNLERGTAVEENRLSKRYKV